jgi:hypothetical protein
MHRTAAEAKNEHIARMGKELGEFYSAFWQELAWIHQKWSEYVALFGTNPGRIDLLNSAASKFFRTILDSLWDDVLLHLARLTDSPKSMGKDNLTVRRLPQLGKLKSTSIPIADLVAKAVAATEFARDWRNRKLAHGDLALALGRQVHPLAPASSKSVKDALQSLVAVLNALAEVYLGSTTMFESDGADAETLLYILRDGLRHEAERQERIRNRNYRPDDLRPDPL